MANERQHSTFDIDEEIEDLEALRRAALQSLKRKNEAEKSKRQPSQSDQYYNQGGRPPRGSPNKRGRFYGGRNARNGQFYNAYKNHNINNSRATPRTTNLINLTPAGDNKITKETEKASEKDIKFLLPQERYCRSGKEEKEDKQEDGTSKFDRYKDSDKSEEETDEDNLLATDSEDDSPGKLFRHDSLEALMEELDAEIQGKSKVKDKEDTKENKPKVKTKSKKKKDDEAKKVEHTTPEEQNKNAEQQSKDKKCDIDEKKEAVEEKLEKTPDNIDKDKEKEPTPEKLEEPETKRRRLADHERDDFHHFRDRDRRSNRRSRSPNYPRNRYPPSGPPRSFPPFGPSNVGISSMFNPNFFPPPNISAPPSFLDRPLSPLMINTETLQTQTMAPLSPRSAAFVLQNRAIIEKRKRSPRRSYSRSLSPRSRSISPRRSPISPPRRRLRSPSPPNKLLNRAPMSPHRPLSPLRRRPLSPRRRSISPKRVSPKRRSLSPKRRSVSPKRRSVSPRRRSISPRRRQLSPRRRSVSPRKRSVSPRRRSISPKRRSLSPKRGNRKEGGKMSPRPRQHIRERLGQKSHQRTEKPESKEEKSKTVSGTSLKKDDKEPLQPLDPVLEARKRKFESREIKVKEGVIRLKKNEPKVEKVEEKQESVPEKDKTENKNAEKDVKPTLTQPEIKKVEKDPELLLEEALLADDDIDLGLHLFSDDESGSENEGRFKEKEKNSTLKPPVLPFAKLVSSTKPEVKKTVIKKPVIVEKKVEEKKVVTAIKMDELRSNTPPIPKKEKEPITFNLSKDDNKAPKVEIDAEAVEERREKIKKKKTVDKTKSPKSKVMMLKPERHPLEKKFERKIEIKIKNPSKYEKGGKTKEERKLEKKAKKLLLRIEEMQQKQAVSEDETIIEEEDEDMIDEDDFDSENEDAPVSDGDLRAQLSKKRAGRVTKIPPQQEVNKRLLQNALQNALLKRTRTQEFSNSDKLPIHMRLGITGRDGTFSGKTKKKSKRRKTRDMEEQV